MNDQKNIILIVEDDEALLKALEEKLKIDNYQVYTASSGNSALQILSEQKPNLVILDRLIPGLSGMSVLRKVRTEEWGKSIQVIILSNLEASEEIKQQVKQDDKCIYLLKSECSLNELINQVKQKLLEQT